MDKQRFNSNLVSWGSIIFIIEINPEFGGGGQRMFGFNNFQTGDEQRERELIYGQNRAQAPMGYSAGEYNPGEPKVRFLQHAASAGVNAGFDSLITMLGRAAPDKRSYGNVTMYWTVQVVEGPLQAFYEWEDVTIKGPSGQWERGPAGLYEEIGFQCLRKKVNGFTLYDSSEEGG